MAQTMRAVVLHAPGKPLSVEDVSRPTVRDHDVIVKVEACGIIPNLVNIVAGKRQLLPFLPAVIGLDAAGTVEEVGKSISRFKCGDRVYINPALSCGTCKHCHAGQGRLCVDMALRGYFGFTPGALDLMREYPWGAFAEYTLAPERNLLRLPDSVSFEQAARFGYLGTAYAAVRTAAVHTGSCVLVNGATGTLGVATVLFSLASGASRILVLGRNTQILNQLVSLAPGRVKMLTLGSQPLTGWIKAETNGYGPDIIVDCTTLMTPPTVLEEALESLAKGGIAVNAGGLTQEVRINPLRFMNSGLQFRGSSWFEMSDITEMAEVFDRGVVDLSVIKTQVFPLDQIVAAMEAVAANRSGFSNIVLKPTLA